MKVICKLIYATLLTALISSQIAAQNNPAHREKLHNAKSLYERAMYPAAMKIVNDIISESGKNQITQTELSDAEAIGVPYNREIGIELLSATNNLWIRTELEKALEDKTNFFKKA